MWLFQLILSIALLIIISAIIFYTAWQFINHFVRKQKLNFYVKIAFAIIYWVIVLTPIIVAILD